MSTTKIKVDKTDNELYLLAIQQATKKGAPSGSYSSELLHIKSGFSDTVKHEFRPGACLAPGKYALVMIGINWGGPEEFKVTLTTNSAPDVHAFAFAPNTPPGSVWSDVVPITVP
jgi:hypothetical protein